MPSEGRREIFCRSCGVRRRRRDRPHSRGRGRFAHGGRVPFLPPSAAGELHAAAAGENCCRAAAGDAPLPGRGARGGTGHPDLRPGFLYPLLRLPLTFRSAATPVGRAAKARGPQLRPRYHLWRTAAVWGRLRPRFPRIQVRGRWCRSERVITVCLDCSRRAGCPHPAG